MMRKATLALAVFVVLALAALPGFASGGNRSETIQVGAGGDWGNVFAEWQANPEYNGFQIFVSGEKGFSCHASGQDSPMPTYQKVGLDRVVMSHSVSSSEFDYCVPEDHPELIIFDIEVTADYVEKVVRSENRTILKGDGHPSSVQFQAVHGSGISSGIVQGETIAGWTYGSFSEFGYNDGGPPTTYSEP